MFAELAVHTIGFYSGLSEERKQVLQREGFSYEKTKEKVEGLLRSGAQQYLPDVKLLSDLKLVNSARVWDVLGEDAAYIYKKAYSAVKLDISTL